MKQIKWFATVALAWTHPVEKVRWEEDYKVEPFNNEHGARLVATKARIRAVASVSANASLNAFSVRARLHLVQPRKMPATTLKLSSDQMPENNQVSGARFQTLLF